MSIANFRRVFHSFANVSEPIQTIVLLFVSFLGFYTFYDDQKSRRQAFTIELASQYTSEPMLSYRLTLISAIGGAQQRLGKIRMGGRELSGYFVSGEAGVEAMQQISEALIALDLYFLSVASCVGGGASDEPSDEGRNNEGVCDRELMFQLLNRDPIGFQSAFGELLDQLKDQYHLPNLGSGLKKLSIDMAANGAAENGSSSSR